MEIASSSQTCHTLVACNLSYRPGQRCRCLILTLPTLIIPSYQVTLRSPAACATWTAASLSHSHSSHTYHTCLSGHTSVARSLSYLDSGVVYVGSKTGDSQVGVERCSHLPLPPLAQVCGKARVGGITDEQGIRWPCCLLGDYSYCTRGQSCQWCAKSARTYLLSWRALPHALACTLYSRPYILFLRQLYAAAKAEYLDLNCMHTFPALQLPQKQNRWIANYASTHFLPAPFI